MALQNACDSTYNMIIYDFCGTLFRSNTTLDFLKYLAKKEGLFYKIKYYYYWIKAKSDKVLFGKNDIKYIKTRILTLKGMKRENIRSYADAFVDYLFRDKLNSPIYESFIADLRNNGKVIILSNTLYEILESFRKRNDVKEIYGSQLEYDNHEICNGRYNLLINEKGKYVFLSEKIDKEAIKNALFYTDDEYSDNDMISMVKKTVLLQL